MNKCCKSLLFKGLSLSRDQVNFRAFSSMLHYSSLGEKKIYFSYENKLNGKLFNNKMPVLLIHSQNNHLARHSKKNTDFSQKPLSKVKEKFNDTLESVFKPLEVKPILTEEKDNIGIELGGHLDKAKINEILTEFKQNKKIYDLFKENGLNVRMFNEGLLSFRRFCLQSKTLPTDLHIKLCDISKNAANVLDLYPYFWKHVNELYPHLNCMDDLKKISDLTEPSFWYIEARDIKRKIIYHCGPTNSGKTYSALKSFQNSDSGIYCGPLKLLANEVFIKTNNSQINCDLVTGEERKYSISPEELANHMACTVEMVNLEKNYDVAVIDEIQMIKDLQRGWAWTRAFLGLKAKEIHLCGDSSGVDLISDLCFLTNDDLQVFNYDRLTKLDIMNEALNSYSNVQPGDCFVCFNKKQIFSVAKALESLGHEVAVIYGSMPPGIKLAQAKKFNDPNHKCKILVATDAIGMGLNLNIKRIIFHEIVKPQTKEKSSETNGSITELEEITTSQALQIAGRAGRFNTQFPDGSVTTFKPQDLPKLKHILKQPLEKTLKAGLHPTAEQIELFSYHLPDHSLSDLIKIFMSICTLDDGQYFMCKFDDIIYLAGIIDHFPIKIKAKYTFACSPIATKKPYAISFLIKFVRLYSLNEAVTIEYLKNQLKWKSIGVPEDYDTVSQLESVYDVLDLYLWLSFRFPSIFPYTEQVKEMRLELEQKIGAGVEKIFDLKKLRRSLSTNLKKSKHDKLMPNDMKLVDIEMSDWKKKDLIKNIDNKQNMNASKKINISQGDGPLKQEKKLENIEFDNLHKINILKKETARLEIQQGISSNKETKPSQEQTNKYPIFLDNKANKKSPKNKSSESIKLVSVHNKKLSNIFPTFIPSNANETKSISKNNSRQTMKNESGSLASNLASNNPNEIEKFDIYSDKDIDIQQISSNLVSDSENSTNMIRSRESEKIVNKVNTTNCKQNKYDELTEDILNDRNKKNARKFDKNTDSNSSFNESDNKT